MVLKSKKHLDILEHSQMNHLLEYNRQNISMYTGNYWKFIPLLRTSQHLS